MKTRLLHITYIPYAYRSWDAFMYRVMDYKWACLRLWFFDVDIRLYYSPWKPE